MSSQALAALSLAAVTFISTMTGGLTALRWPGRVQALMALAGGVVLAAAFFDLLPDAVERASAIHMSVGMPLGATLVGYLTFHLLDRAFHKHDDSDARGAAGLVGAGGFVVHSFFDGLAIGLGFNISLSVGFVVAAAVIGHDLSDGLNTVSVMVAHGQSKRRSLLLLIADATTPLLGALVAVLTPVPAAVFPIAIGFFSGLFIFSAAERLLPQSESLSWRVSTGLTVGGAIAMFLVSRLA